MNNQYLFNVQCYSGLYTDDKKSVLEANKKLLEYQYSAKNNVPVSIEGVQTVKMKTVYPGLLIGIGNPHDSGHFKEDEIKLGFTFDYTTGLPYIPGSTVKGVIRSVFKEPDKKKGTETEEQYKVRQEAFRNRIQYLIGTIATILKSDKKDEMLSEEKIAEFERETFGDHKNGRGDIFFDAFPVQGNEDGKLFAYEYITPHNNIFCDPVPLRLLKIVPDVVFEFRFKIYDSKVIPELTAERKKELFKTIIADFGIGAKTNVGFGTMIALDASGKNKNLIAVNIPQGYCRKCGKKIENDQEGNYCLSCAKERPKCQQCKKKKVDWDQNKSQWKTICVSCQKKIQTTPKG